MLPFSSSYKHKLLKSSDTAVIPHYTQNSYSTADLHCYMMPHSSAQCLPLLMRYLSQILFPARKQLHCCPWYTVGRDKHTPRTTTEEDSIYTIRTALGLQIELVAAPQKFQCPGIVEERVAGVLCA